MRLIIVCVCVSLLVVHAAAAVPSSRKTNEKQENAPQLGHSSSSESKQSATTGMKKLKKSGKSSKSKSFQSGNGRSIQKTSDQIHSAGDHGTEAHLLSMLHDQGSNDQHSSAHFPQSGAKQDFFSKNENWLTDEGAAGKMMDAFRQDQTHGVAEPHGQGNPMHGQKELHGHSMPSQGMHQTKTGTDDHFHVMKLHPNTRDGNHHQGWRNGAGRMHQDRGMPQTGPARDPQFLHHGMSGETRFPGHLQMSHKPRWNGELAHDYRSDKSHSMGQERFNPKLARMIERDGSTDEDILEHKRFGHRRGAQFGQEIYNPRNKPMRFYERHSEPHVVKYGMKPHSPMVSGEMEKQNYEPLMHRPEGIISY